MKYLILTVLLLFPLSVSAHRYHTSFTRIDYNEPLKLAEITIQTFTHDLEAALERQEGKRIVLDSTPHIDELIIKYLANQFVLKNKNGEQKKMRWIGIQQKTDAVWLYVETEMPEGFDGATLHQRFLQNIFDDQTNLVTTRYKDLKTDLVFKPGDEPQMMIRKKE